MPSLKIFSLFLMFSLVALMNLSPLKSTCHAATTGWLAEPSFMTPSLSLQGFTGLLNTPNAHLQEEGSVQSLYSNQIDQRWRGYTGFQDNYLLSVGMFNFAEIGGRLTNTASETSMYNPASHGVRDLSANIKLSSAPLTRAKPYYPVIGAGIQDVGGGSTYLRTSYLVLSEDLWRFRFSAGYGRGPDRMKGLFGGAEFKAHDWVYLLGEYDTRETNVGIRIISPEIWITPVRIAATAKTSLDYKPGNIDIALGITFPLDFRKHEKAEKVQNKRTEAVQNKGTETVQSSKFKVQDVIKGPEPQTLSLEQLRDRLVRVGFINVRVGRRENRELVVEYEDTIFNHNELDALGVVAGIVADAAPERFETTRIIIRRQGIIMVQLTAPLLQLRACMEPAIGPARESGSLQNLRDSLTIRYDTDTAGVLYLTEADAYAFPNSTLILAPGLTTFVGTEVGVFDYLLALKPELISHLWKGGLLNARWDIPVAWSHNLDDGEVYAYSRKKALMDRLMLFQGIKLAPDIMANLGVGMVLNDIYGTLNELTWSPGNGAHRFKVTQAWAENDITHRKNEVYLGSYRYFFSPLDLSLEGTAGRFWNRDKGFSAELKRFFGDASFSTYYKNSTTEEGKHWQVAGVQFAFPLTPRKDLKIGPVQLRGTDEWSYSQETTLAVGGQKSNDVLSQPLAITPLQSAALYRAYYNRDRLSSEYIMKHLDRLREAWLKYRD